MTHGIRTTPARPSPAQRPTAPLPPAAHAAITRLERAFTPTPPNPEAAQITGFRIMRQTEIAPEWWGQPTEVGETGSATVADSFCTTQNAVTMDANRAKRILFYADPIAAAVTA